MGSCQAGAVVLAEGPIPVLGGHELMILLLQVGLLLALAVLLGRLAVRLGMSAIVGELLAGVLLGPSLLARVLPGLSGWLVPLNPEQFHLLDAVGQIGVILLVGITGTQLDFGLVRRRSGTAALVAIPGLAIPLALGIAGGFLVPATLLARGSDRLVFALFVGVAMSVSAIPVIAKTLQDMGLLQRDIGQLMLAAATVDDTLGWPMLSVVAAMAAKGLLAAAIGRQVGLLVAFLAAVTLLGRPAVGAVMRIASRADGDGPITACAVVIMVLGAAATQAMGLEAVFGAFVAGIVMGTCGHLDPARLASLRTVALCVIAPVFFATVGLRIDLTTLDRPVVLLAVLMLLAIAIVGKFAGAFVGAKASRLTGWEALALGAGLNARGVVQLVVATVGLRLGVLTTVTYTIIVLIAIATSMMTPPIVRIAMAHVEYTAEERLRCSSIWNAGALSGTLGEVCSSRQAFPALGGTVGILRLAHVDVRTPDLELSTAYYTEVLGLQLAEKRDDTVYLKCWDEEDHHSIRLRYDPRTGLDLFSFRVEREDDLAELENKVQQYGCQVTRVSRGESVGQGESLRFVIPSGQTMELVYDLEKTGNILGKLNPSPVPPPDLAGIAPPRLDHMLINAEEVGESAAFFGQVLGFRMTEQVLDANGHQLGVWLERSHSPHDIAIVNGPNGALHHFAFWLDDWDSVRKAADILAYNGVQIDQGPTRHGVTRGNTIYFFDPLGIRNEVFTGGYRADPDFPSITWTEDQFGRGLFYYENVLSQRFLRLHT